MYWGIIPAFFHAFIPALSDRVATLIASTVALFFLLKIISHLADGKRSLPIYIMLTIGIGFPSLVLVSRVYEEAIAFALAFGFIGTFYCLKQTKRSLSTGLIFLGLAGLTRTTWFAACGI